MRVLTPTPRDFRSKLLRFAGAAAVILATGPAWVRCQRSTSLVPELAPGVHGMGFVLACVGVAVAIATFGALLFSIATARRATGVRRHGPLMEVLWALIPIVIVVAAVAPSFRALATHSANPTVTYRCETRAIWD